jgi:hypothetical protein
MRFATITAVMLASLSALAIGSAPAEAKGCLKGAVVGGVALGGWLLVGRRRRRGIPPA